MSTLSDLNSRYDVVVIGGGVHGAAAALEATRLGYAVLLVERSDFCSGTSANSLKIIHGGLRYLQSADVRRSRESALEQIRLLRRAPHLVEPLPCLMGTGGGAARSRPALALGLWLYDNVICFGLPGRSRGRTMSKAEAARLVGEDLFAESSGAALWYDARVLDTERLVLTYLKTAEQAGAHVLNYVSAVGVERRGRLTVGLRDRFTAASSEVAADVVVDTASLLKPWRAWARAVNLVLPRRTWDHAVGLRLPREAGNSDRLFFATPHPDATIVGTWYFPDREEAPDELSRAELEGCLADVRVLLRDPGISSGDIQRIHLGRLPVNDEANPLSLLEKAVVRRLEGDAGVISVTGVKYTTAAPTARKALRLAGLSPGADPGEPGQWYGAGSSLDETMQRFKALVPAPVEEYIDELTVRRICCHYGSAAIDIGKLALQTDRGFEHIPGTSAIRAELRHSIEHEHCKTVADFILRRSGIGSVDAPPVATLEYCSDAMAQYLGWTDARRGSELDDLVSRYRRMIPGE